MSKLISTIMRIEPLDEASMSAARTREDDLTKPRGSLGRLEDIAVQLAGIQRRSIPRISDRAVITLAGDHGVTVEGVSLYPAEVTQQMMANFLRGGAAINVLARQVGARVVIVDVGVAGDLQPHPDLLIRKVAYGTRNIASGPAMTREQAVRAIEVGIEIVEAEVGRGLDIVATGEMGIGNTTPSAAITAAVTGATVSEVTGRGTGLGDAALLKKIAVIERALAVNHPDPTDGVDLLAKVGGYEIGAIAGVILGAAANGVAVVIDGFISTAGALVAATLAPQAIPYMIAGHRSVEGGHDFALAYLKLKPLLDLNLRLGEGTGACLAIVLVEAAVRTLAEMATFGEAGVTG